MKQNDKDWGFFIARCTSCHINSLEMLPIYYGATLLALQYNVENYVLNASSVVFVLSRLLYNISYIFGTHELIGLMRTNFWALSLVAAVGPLVTVLPFNPLHVALSFLAMILLTTVPSILYFKVISPVEKVGDLKKKF